MCQVLRLTLFRITRCLEKMKRHVVIIAYHPAVVRFGGYVKEAARSQLDNASVLECRHRGTGQHEPDVLQGTEFRPGETRHFRTARNSSARRVKHGRQG